MASARVGAQAASAGRIHVHMYMCALQSKNVAQVPSTENMKGMYVHAATGLVYNVHMYLRCLVRET